MARINKAINDQPAVAAEIDAITHSSGFGERLFATLACPPNLTYFIDGLERTLDVIRRGQAAFAALVDTRTKFRCDLHTFETHLQSIIDSEIRLRSTVTEPDRLGVPMSRPTADSPHPFRHYCLSTCVYWSGLFYTDPSGEAGYDYFFAELAPHFLALTSAVEPGEYARFAASWAAKKGNKDVPLPSQIARFHSRVERAGLAARRLTLPEHRELYATLSDPTAGRTLPDRVYTALLRIQPSQGSEDQASEDDRGSREARAGPRSADNPTDTDQSLLNDLALLFVLTIPGWHRPAHTEEGVRARGGGGGGHRNTRLPDGYVRVSGTDYVLHTVYLGEDGQVDVIQRLMPSDDDDGDEPLDERLDEPWISVTEDDPDGANKGLAERIVRSHRQAGHIARYHQQLTLALDLPTHAELRSVVTWLRGLATPSDAADWPDTYPEMPLIIAAVLSTGRSAAELAAQHFEVDDARLAAPVTYLRADKAWKFRINGPTYALQEYTPVASEQPLTPTIVVPDMGVFGELLERLPAHGVESFHIPRQTPAFRRALDATLTAITGDRHATADMLPRVLFRLLLNVSRGDLAVASMLTGQRVAHSTTTLYYSTYPARMVCGAYRQAAKAIWQTRLRAAESAQPSAGGAPAASRYCGARQCPTDAAVIALFQRLAAPLQKHDIPDFLAYHNQYTVYVLAVQTLALGYRGVISPALSDWALGERLVTFSDKTRSDYHRRVSYIPRVLQRLLLCYSDHRVVLNRRFGNTVDTQPDGAIYALWNATVKRFQPFHPNDFDAYSDAYGLPLRSLRHYMRTRLAQIVSERGRGWLSMEVVDAWMGHWHFGLSPREAGSTFNPILIRRLVDGPVTKILRDVHVVAYSSRYVDHVW